MQRLIRWSLFVLLACAAARALANSPTVSSAFDTDTDGWTNVMLPYPSAVPVVVLNTYVPVWSAGRLGMVDPDGSGSSGDCQYWCAPAKFLGNQSGSGLFSCDLSDAGSGYGPFTQEDVVLTGGGLTLSYSFGGVPPSNSTPATFTLDLYGGGAHVGGLGGPAATRTQVGSVLSSLTALYVRAEYQLGPDTQYMDNVSLLTPNAGASATVPPTELALAAPWPNPAAGETHVAFTTAQPGAVDLAVIDAQGRRMATLANGVAPAGAHAAAWDGRDASGRAVRAGLYWVTLTQDHRRAVRRIVRVN